MRKLEHYFMCFECADKMGGIFPEGHVCTVTEGECPYCHDKNVTLVPWVDFNWPKDKKKDKTAKVSRD